MKRLGSANFHQLPINAPKCPFANFQRDGHMQMTIPKGRANYEPNGLSEDSESRPGDEPGPRECPVTGYHSATALSGDDEQGDKLRIRPESFADHYSQARLFFRSLAVPEQAHLASALVFELSKVGLLHIRKRMLSNLVNVDPDLAKRVAEPRREFYASTTFRVLTPCREPAQLGLSVLGTKALSRACDRAEKSAKIQ